MSNKQRRDGDRRPSDRSDNRDRDRRDSQPDEEQQRRPGDPDLQESDSLTALKAILGKVATLLGSLKLTQDECVSLVEQLYGSVLDMDLKLAGETDDKRKASIQSHIQNTNVTRSGGKLVVEFPKMEAPKPAAEVADAAPQKATNKPAPRPAAPSAAPSAAPEAATEAVTETETQTAAAPAAPAESEPEPQPEPAPSSEAPAEAAAAPAEPVQDKLDLEG